MATQGPSFVGTGANFNDAGTTAWSNPTNAQGDTTGTAATSIAGASVNNTSQVLRLSNFGFTIPSDATIDGITVEIENSVANNNRIAWNNVRLMKALTEGGTNLSDAAALFTKAFKTFGSGSNLWGNSLAPSDVNGTGFGVSVKVIRTATQAATASIFRARITVTYTPAPELHNGTATLTGGGVAVLVPAKGAATTVVATGGGALATSCVKGGQTSLVAVGGGVFTEVATKTAFGAPALTGGGTLAVTAEADQNDPGEPHSGSVSLTGGGSFRLPSIT